MRRGGSARKDYKGGRDLEVNTVEITPHDLCTGCFACMNICPANAIQADADSEGFLCPSVDKDKCVNCGKCVRVCPILNKKESGSIFEPECYAAWSNDDNIRFQSTSGGVFTHLAEVVIERGGAVVGARYRSDNLVEHAVIHKKEDIEQLRQSKYVQSEIGFVFRDMKKELENGKPLLFAGTPCQCAGLKAFLEKDYENLLLCDFICRGVNSPLVYMKYLSELEERYGSKVKRVWFKNKTFGWNNFATKIIFEDGQEYIADRETDPFMLGYIKSKTTLYMRESCYQCRFKGIERLVDITLGDFWGIEKKHSDIDIRNGVSAVIVYSEKGKMIFNNIDRRISRIECYVYDVVLSNKCITKSAETIPKENRSIFKKNMRDSKKIFSEIISEIYK